jgi:hypothetical protein
MNGFGGVGPGNQERERTTIARQGEGVDAVRRSSENIFVGGGTVDMIIIPCSQQSKGPPEGLSVCPREAVDHWVEDIRRM